MDESAERNGEPDGEEALNRLVEAGPDGSIAELLGGTVLNAAAPLPTEALPTGVFTWIAEIAVSAITNYGIVGFIISTVLSGIVGWRAAELYKLTNP